MKSSHIERGRGWERTLEPEQPVSAGGSLAKAGPPPLPHGHPDKAPLFRLA